MAPIGTTFQVSLLSRVKKANFSCVVLLATICQYSESMSMAMKYRAQARILATALLHCDIGYVFGLVTWWRQR